MFGRKNAEGEEQAPETSNRTENASPSPAAASPAPRAASPARAEISRPVIAIPGGHRRSASSVSDHGDMRKLTVGKGLSLAGEITACDVLVVEGKVEAKLTDGKMLEITEAGQFRGSVEIESADIAGRYDGQLVVHGRLTVRSTGRISGMVKYGELEINAGGQIIGELQVTGGGAQASGNNFKSAAKFASTGDEQDQERKSA